MASSPFPDLPHCSFRQTSATETSQDHHLEPAGCPLTVAGHQTRPGEHLMAALVASHTKAVCYLIPVLRLEHLGSGEYQSTVAYLTSAA